MLVVFGLLERDLGCFDTTVEVLGTEDQSGVRPDRSGCCWWIDPLEDRIDPPVKIDLGLDQIDLVVVVEV